MLAVGYRGPILLEDAHDLVGMMVSAGRAPKAVEWVDELRLEAEGNAFAGFGA